MSAGVRKVVWSEGGLGLGESGTKDVEQESASEAEGARESETGAGIAGASYKGAQIIPDE